MLNTKERKSQHTFIFRVSWLLASWLAEIAGFSFPSASPHHHLTYNLIPELRHINDTPRTEEGSKKKKKTKKAAMQQQHERQAQRLIELNSIRDRSERWVCYHFQSADTSSVTWGLRRYTRATDSLEPGHSSVQSEFLWKGIIDHLGANLELNC